MSRVLVTGASAGIGKAFARALAREGRDLLLVARREERLRTLADEIRNAHGVCAEITTADLSGPEGVDEVVRGVEESGGKVAGLVNNAGFGLAGPFHELPQDEQLDMIQVNVNSLVALTWRLVPKLRRAQDPFVINVASTAAFQAGPGMAVYYATKAFVLSFSEALHEELKDKGVAVSALCPGPTESEFAAVSGTENTKLFEAGTMSAEAVVHRSLSRRRRAVVVPGVRNRLLALGSKFSPRSLSRKVAAWLQS